MIDSHTLEVCSFLKQKHIIIPPENQWLQGCISCFKSQQPHNIAALKAFAYEQWLLADLKDVAAPSLPTNCTSAKKLIISGKYAVQINYFLNVAEPFYKQLQKIRRPQSEVNLSVDLEKDKNVKEPTGNRALSFEITDGEVIIKGFEDRPIKGLVDPFVPGTKVILLGPIECRNGILLLKDDNLKILGGEVEDLHVTNAVENVLSRCLRVEENPTPYGSLVVKDEIGHENLLDEDDDALLQLAEEMDNFENVAVSSRSPVSDSSTNCMPPKSEILNCLSYSNETAAPPVNSHFRREVEVITIDDDDDDDGSFALAAAQSASLAEKVAQPSQKAQGNLLGFVKTERIDDQFNPQSLRAQLEESYCDMASTAPCESYVNQVSREERNYSPPSHQRGEVSRLIDNKLEGVRLSLEETEEDSFTVDVPSPSPATSKTTDESFPPATYPATRLLHVEILKLIRKLEIKDDMWFLTAIVNIKGCELEVDFSPDILNRILGFTPKDLHDAKKEVKKNPEKKEQLNDHLRNCQHKIRELSCKMEIHFDNFIKNPQILEIIGFDYS